MESIARPTSTSPCPPTQKKPAKKARRRSYPLVHVHQEYTMLVWSCQRLEGLTRVLAGVDDDTGLKTDENASAILVEIGARLARVRTLLQEVLTPDMLTVIAQEEAEFQKLIAWKEKAGAGKTLVTA